MINSAAPNEVIDHDEPAKCACHKAVWQNFGVFLVFLGLAIIAMWSYAPLPAWETESPIIDTDARYYAYNIWAVQRNLTAQPFHLFDGTFYYPIERTLVGTDPIIPQCILTLPLYWIGCSALFVYHATLALMLALAGWSAWWAVRKLTGDNIAGWLSGVLWAFNLMSMSSLARPQAMSLFTWPLLLVALVNHARRPNTKSAIWIFLALVPSMYTGWYMTVLTGMLVAAWMGAMLIVRKGCPGWRWFLTLLAAGAAASIVLLPMYVAFKANATFIYYDHDLSLRHRFFPHHLIVPNEVVPLGRLMGKLGVHISTYWPAYTGLAGWAIGALAFWRWGRSPRRVKNTWNAMGTEHRALTFFILLLLGMGVVLGVGPRIFIGGRDISLPFAWVGNLVPQMAFMRWPVRYIHFITFALSISSGLLLSRLLIDKSLRLRTTICLAVAVLTFGDLFPARQVERAPVEMPPLLERLAERDDINAIAEVPIQSVQDFTEANLRATVHEKRLHQGKIGAGVGILGHQDLSDYLNQFPDPVARAAFEYLKLDAILLRSEQDSPFIIPRGWEEIDQSENFHLLRPNTSAGSEVERLLAQLEPVETPPDPITFQGTELLNRAWREKLQLDGMKFRSSRDPSLTIAFDPPLDTTRYRRFIGRIRLTGPTPLERSQIFWRSSKTPDFNELRSAGAPLPADGEWHEVVFDFSDNPAWIWSGGITHLRWDALSQSGFEGEFDFVRIE